jgi:uncharacterized membrane protein YgcG
MDAQLEIKLIECLSQLEDGEPLDRILARYPDDAASLRPLLETATALGALREEPSEPARIASRRAFLARAHDLRESASQRRFWLPRRMVTAIAALVLTFIFLGGTVAASALALPDEPLYGVKRAVEDAQLLVASSAQKDQLVARFEQRRRDEVNLLLAMRRDAAIAFEGTIESIQPDGLDISGLYLHVDRATVISGTPIVGSRARVQGYTQGGRLFAAFVNVEPGSGPTMIPAAQPTATTAPGETPNPAPSPSARPSPRPEVTRQPERAPTQAPSPTLAPARAPSETPIPPTRIPPTRILPTPIPPTPIPPTPVPPAPEEEIEFSGTLEATGATWIVSGTRFEIDGGTEIRGTLFVGDRVKVRARRLADGRLIAKRIERAEDSIDNGGGDDNGNDNSGDDKGNDNSGDDNGNDNSGDDKGNDNGGDDSGDDSGGGNDSGDESGGGDDSGGGGGDDRGGDGGGGDSGGGGGDDKP